MAVKLSISFVLSIAVLGLSIGSNGTPLSQTSVDPSTPTAATSNSDTTPIEAEGGVTDGTAETSSDPFPTEVTSETTVDEVTGETEITISFGPYTTTEEVPGETESTTTEELETTTSFPDGEVTVETKVTYFSTYSPITLEAGFTAATKSSTVALMTATGAATNIVTTTSPPHTTSGKPTPIPGESTPTMTKVVTPTRTSSYSINTSTKPEHYDCGPNEVFSRCGSCSYNTCRGWVGCLDQRCVQGCFCRVGYVRAYPEGPCITYRSCPSMPFPLVIKQ